MCLFSVRVMAGERGFRGFFDSEFYSLLVAFRVSGVFGVIFFFILLVSERVFIV